MAESRKGLFRQLSADQWAGFRKGVEKEGLRVDPDGFIAQTPHPKELGSTLTHTCVTTDYSESLLELITPVCNSTTELLDSLRDIHTFVQSHLGDEVFWAASMPCRLAGDPSIPIAEYGTSNSGRLRHVYRQGLAVRYGRMMQSIAGVHYNFSMPETFWQHWQSLLGESGSLQDFKSEQYFWLIRNFRRRSWLLMLLFGASPALDASFVENMPNRLRPFSDSTLYSETATSLRMGDLGYHNNAQSSLTICFNELKTYTDTLYRAIHTPWPPYEKLGVQNDAGEFIQINTNVLQIENEYYSAMRPKRTAGRGEKPIDALNSRGVEYIEVRCLDLDPFDPLGISAEQADFLDLFLFDCLLSESTRIGDNECARVDNSYKDVVENGRQADLTLCFDQKTTPVMDAASSFLDRLEPLALQLDTLSGGSTYQQALAAQRHKLTDAGHLPAAQVLNAMRESGMGHNEWTLAQSRKHQAHLRQTGLPPEKAAAYEKMAQQSLAEQEKLEAADDLSFSDFLRSYLAH